MNAPDSNASATPVSAEFASPPPSIRILVVDGHEADAYVMGCYLRQLGCSYDVASNGDEALIYVDRRPYDAVLIDVVMPNFNGFELASLIRSREIKSGMRRALIVAMTASNYIDTQRKIDAQNRYVEFGMDGSLTKPCNPQLLAQTLGLKLKV